MPREENEFEREGRRLAWEAERDWRALVDKHYRILDEEREREGEALEGSGV